MKEDTEQRVECLHERLDRFYAWAGELQKQFRNFDRRLRFLESRFGQEMMVEMTPHVDMKKVASRLASISKSSGSEELLVLLPDVRQAGGDDPGQSLPDGGKPGENLLADALIGAWKDPLDDLVST